MPYGDRGRVGASYAAERPARPRIARFGWLSKSRRCCAEEMLYNARIGHQPLSDGNKKPSDLEGFCEAAEGTRTLDLLHGKQTL